MVKKKERKRNIHVIIKNKLLSISNKYTAGLSAVAAALYNITKQDPISTHINNRYKNDATTNNK